LRSERARPELVDAATGDRRPLCVECGEPFAPDAPRRDRALPAATRCPACRERRLAERNAAHRAAHAAGPWQAATHRERGVATGPEEGHAAVFPARCAECGRAIRLPFEPDANRPVFCRACREARAGR
jgi:CxxC-x17-CxxC domain-containing protein